MSRISEMIQLAAQATKYGNLNLNLEVHDSEVRALVTEQHTQLNYPGDGTQKAVEDLLAILAQIRNESRGGVTTFTLEHPGGRVKKLYIHRQIKHILTGK